MHRNPLFASLLLTLFLGCGASPRSGFAGRAEMATAEAPMSPAPAPNSAYFAKDAAATAADASKPPGAAAAPDSPAGPTAASMDRKIIYDADLALIVEDFARTEPQISRLVESVGGYVADQTMLGSPGSQRSARWKARVPADRLDTFRTQIKALGEIERDSLTSSDVTEQFYDTEARIKAKQVEEETLLKLLTERGGKLEDVLKVEIELSRVRGEIEQMQGRLRVLANLSSLATVTIHVRERDKYQPAPPVAPDFATLVSRTFHRSVDGLVDAGKAVVLFVVAASVWLPLIVLGIIVGWLVLRGLGRHAIRLGRRLWVLARTPITPPQSS